MVTATAVKPPPATSPGGGVGKASGGSGARATKRVAIRLWDWSEWCRQVIRGVQRYAHDTPDWKVYVDVAAHHQPEGNTQELRPEFDGIISAVMSDVRRWGRVLATTKTKVVPISASLPAALEHLPRVQIDNKRIAEAIGQHLRAGGFRELAYFVSRPTTVNDRRYACFKEYAEANGMTLHTFDFPSTNKSGSVSLGTVVRWLQRLPKPIGVAAWNIDLARKIVQACIAANIAMPEQVAVVAWDDDPLLAETVEPTITGVVIPAERLGYEAARLLDRLMRGEVPDGNITVECSGLLRVRQSSDVSTLKDRDVFLALQYMREHAAEAIKISEVAEAMRVSRKKMELDFARVISKTPYEAMMEIRMELATRLIVETDWTTAKIAKRSGMGSETTLRRMFVRHHGMPPSEYRTRFGGT